MRSPGKQKITSVDVAENSAIVPDELLMELWMVRMKYS